MALIEKIGNVALNLDYYSGNDLYSDGKVEDEMLDIVKNNAVADYDKIIDEKKDWTLMYHLSKQRQNIISWYPINSDMSVLEIGAGCGAVTGSIAQRAKNVTCIELSKKRSTINAFRNKEYDNIEIIVGNFQDIECKMKKKYDIVTLIGVLEYAEGYINSEKPYESFLKIAGKHLNKNGAVIVAIENRLGMKYWAGCKEDHVCRYYESIEGYTNTKGVRTFGKAELEKMITDAGYSNYRFYYPYPDYKFANVIYSDKYLPTVGDLINNIRNFDNNRIITFDESKAFNSVIENNLFPEYSNSFLMVLKK